MEDTSTDPGAAGDEMNQNVELPVSTDSLSIDNTVPEVGDSVEFKVGATVTRVVNGIAYCKPDTINGTPMEKSPISPNNDMDETERLRQMSSDADQSATY